MCGLGAKSENVFGAWFKWEHAWMYKHAWVRTSVWACSRVHIYFAVLWWERRLLILYMTCVVLYVYVCVGIQQANHSIAGHVSSMMANRLPSQSSVWKINGMLFLSFSQTHSLSLSHSYTHTPLCAVSCNASGFSEVIAFLRCVYVHSTHHIILHMFYSSVTDNLSCKMNA